MVRGSLPVQGAWIEMANSSGESAAGKRRSPCRERGLKSWLWWALWDAVWSLPVQGAWIEISIAETDRGSIIVAPRAGSVD